MTQIKRYSEQETYLKILLFLYFTLLSHPEIYCYSLTVCHIQF